MPSGRWPGYQSFPVFSLTWGPAGPRYVYYIDETQSLLVSTHLAEDIPMELGDPEHGLGLSFWLPDMQIVSICESPSLLLASRKSPRARRAGRCFLLWASAARAPPSVIPGTTLTSSGPALPEGKRRVQGTGPAVTQTPICTWLCSFPADL